MVQRTINNFIKMLYSHLINSSTTILIIFHEFRSSSKRVIHSLINFLPDFPIIVHGIELNYKIRYKGDLYK